MAKPWAGPGSWWAELSALTGWVERPTDIRAVLFKDSSEIGDKWPKEKLSFCCPQDRSVCPQQTNP